MFGQQVTARDIVDSPTRSKVAAVGEGQQVPISNTTGMPACRKETAESPVGLFLLRHQFVRRETSR